MKIKLVCVGTLKESYLKEMSKEYEKRLSPFCSLEIIEVPEKNMCSTPVQTLEAEGKLIEKHLQGHVFVMDIDGVQMSSPDFSIALQTLKTNGVSTMTFVIGSSNGLCQKIKDVAKTRLSFSKMTFPHQIARVLLLEQIYRAFCIENNITYHK